MIFFLLGINVGILAAVVFGILAIIILLRNKPTIERLLNQTTSKLGPKGVVIEPEDENLQEWIGSLKSQ